ncbi:MAG: hypothetical protein PVI44_06020 [Balneolaceae bacterium]|jgi:hypothetical protein
MEQSTSSSKYRWPIINIPKMLSIAICCAGLSFAACSSDSTGSGDTGGNNGGGNNGGNNIIGTEPTFANVQQIFRQSCGGSNCHINSSQNGVRLDTYENVIQSEAISYDKLAIQPGDAAGSPLIDKIEPNPDVPPRMPQTGAYLSTDRISQIRQWIDNGAEND